MKLKFKGFAHTNSYASAEVKRWYAGEVREVNADVAKYLLKQFGSVFSVVGSQPAGSDRMVKSKAVDLSALDGSISKLKKALASGLLDGLLVDLRNAELNGKTRKSAIEAIEARMAEV